MPRPKKIVLNPLVIEDSNLIANEDGINQALDDIVTGIIRSFAMNGSQHYVNRWKVLLMFKQLDEFSKDIVQGYVGCSEAQAKRYMQVLNACTPFVARWVAAGAKIFRYQEITAEAVRGGILPVIVRQSERLYQTKPD